MKTITSKELKNIINNKEDFQLIDTREDYEHIEFNIGGTLISLGNIISHLAEIEKEKRVVFYCRKGVRSHIAIQRLQQKFPFNNLYNLKGGMEAWQQEFS